LALPSLDAIRRARDDARETLKRGLDPNAKREADRIEAREQVMATLAAEERRRAEDASVQAPYDQWIRDSALRRDANAALKRSFERDVLPALTAKPVRLVITVGRPTGLPLLVPFARARAIPARTRS
jgi:hypothetical protein